MRYTIKPVSPGKCFSVPDIIADRHLRLASGEMIKVLLLLLRNGESTLTVSQISKKLKISEADVEDCLQYWVLTGVITDEGDGAAEEAKEERQSEKADAPKKYVPKQKEEKAPAAKPAAVPPAQETYIRPNNDEVATRMEESKEIADMMNDLQVILGKTFGADGQATFLMLHDRFGLPTEVIYMLAKHCVDIGKSGFSYIEAVGRGWAESEIDTVEKAAEKIASYDKVKTFWSKFVRATDVKNPSPTQKQAAYIEKWVCIYKMSFDLIHKAYEEMSERTGSLSFAYMDKILDDWHSKGYKAPADVELARRTKNDAKAADGGASYSLDDYVKNEIAKKPEYKRKKK